MRKTIHYIDMFAGMGGFREGLTRAGNFVCMGHCEIDKYADRSYRVYPYALHLRKGAGTDQPIVKTLRAGTTLAYYGLYTVRDGVKWMYVMLSDKTTGFVSEQYIKKA